MAAALKPRPSVRIRRAAAVYLIQRRDRRRFKLGTALEPLARARMLPEFKTGALDLRFSLALWLPSKARATQVERGMHKCLAPYGTSPGHHGDGYTEWFSPAAFLPAVRLLQQMPQDERGTGEVGLRPLLAGGAEVIDRIDQSPQEVWWFIEDLLLRLANQLPASAYFNGESWCFCLANFRSAWDGEMQALRPRVMDTDTFTWRLATREGSFLSLTFYQGDTLMMRFVPRALMRSWIEGDALALQVSALMLRFGTPTELDGEAHRG